MEECEQFKHNQHLYNICAGTANMPKWKIDKYRINFGLPPLFNEPIPEVVLSYDNIGYGPGSELLDIYSKQGMPPCQDCFSLARRMNIWGSNCSSKIEEIVEDILPRAKKWVELNMPWVHNLLPNTIEDYSIKIKIKNDISLAIKNYKLNKSKSTVNLNTTKAPPRVGGCGCGGKK